MCSTLRGLLYGRDVSTRCVFTLCCCHGMSCRASFRSVVWECGMHFVFYNVVLGFFTQVLCVRRVFAVHPLRGVFFAQTSKEIR